MPLGGSHDSYKGDGYHNQIFHRARIVPEAAGHKQGKSTDAVNPAADNSQTWSLTRKGGRH